MKKFFVFITVCFSLFLSGCKKEEPRADYSTEEAEQLLNKGDDLEGKTVEFTVDKIAPASAFGYNLQTGEHLNFVSAENPKVKVNETVVAKVENVKSVVGSFIIEYKLLENKGVTKDKTEITEASKQPKKSKAKQTEEFNPADYNAAMPTEEFIREPEANRGKKTMFVARIIQEISSDDENGHFYLATTTPEKNKYVTVQIFVDNDDFHTKILDDDEVRTYVTFVDAFEYKNTNGIKKEVPAFHMDKYEVLK